MSQKFQLNTDELMKIARGAGIAGLGAVLTYLTDAIPTVELGVYAPLVMAAWSIIVNAARKYLTTSE